MTSATPTFNLLDEPWIKVRTSSGAMDVRSLLGVLRDAHLIRAISGEIPTQDVALLRLIEAILLGAARNPALRRQEKAVALWSEWWDAGRFPMDLVAAYCETYRGRFDLLSSETPFFQVADLSTDSGKRSGLRKLIAEIPDGHQFFTTRAGKEIASLSLAEAARWLVHCQAFDPAGIKTGAMGDDRVKGGKGPSFGYPAWTGNLGLLVVEGDNLFETLMLNLPMPISESDAPVWERPTLTAAADVSHPTPTGPADLFTWPSRRVRLFVSGARVVDVQLSNGDRLGPQNQFVNEPLCAWQHSANQSKKSGHDVMMPVLHRPERRLWQGLAAVLVSAPSTQGRGPHNLDWLHTLVSFGVLPPDRVMRVRAVGLEYGTMNSSIVGAVDDVLTAHVSALTDPILMATAVDAAARAHEAVTALAKLSSNLALATGGDSEAPRAGAYELGYSLLDGPYRQWLADLADPHDVEAALQRWGLAAREILRELGARLIDEAGPLARVGRQVAQHGTDKTRHLDAALAENWFRGSLNQALLPRLAQPQEVHS